MPKPVVATADELFATEAKLQSAIDALKSIAATKTELALKEDKTKVAALQAEVNSNKDAASEASLRVATDAKEHTEAAAAAVSEELKKVFAEVKSTHLQAQNEAEKQLQQVDQSIREAFAVELTSLCEKIDAEFQSVREELMEVIDARGKEQTEALLRQRAEIDAAAEGIRQEAAERYEGGQKHTAAEFMRVADDMLKEAQRQDSQLDQASKELHARIDSLTAALKAHEEYAASETSNARREAADCLEEFRLESRNHLGDVDTEAARLNTVLEEIIEVPTRRIEWVIKGATLALRPPHTLDGSMAYNSWFSPKFNAAGASNLQLEIRVFNKTEGPAGGDCGLYLWSPGGMQMNFRLYIGSKWASTEKAYTEPWTSHGSKRLGLLKEQIWKDNDTLSVGVEILEAIRELNLSIAPSPNVQGGAGGPKEGGGPFEGALTFHRHVNHRVLPEVRREVEKMQSRIVRRVEWLLEAASLLPQYFNFREPVCSPVFNAAGIEGMQLIFYPSGYTGVTDGFCSFFLYCPAGVDIKCRITAGNQTREASHYFEDGGAYGRVNFCRFKECVDVVNDTLLMALEIDEARQDLRTSIVLPTAESGAKRLQAQSQDVGRGKQYSHTDPPPAVDGTVKLVRLPDQNCLKDAKLLPSLWTAKALGDMSAPPDGFHSFNVVRDRIKPGGRGHGGGKSSPAPAAAELDGVLGGGTGSSGAYPTRSESMPVLNPGERSQSPGSGRLPVGGRSASGDDSLPLLPTPSGGRMKKVPKGSGAAMRQHAATLSTPLH